MAQSLQQYTYSSCSCSSQPATVNRNAVGWLQRLPASRLTQQRSRSSAAVTNSIAIAEGSASYLGGCACLAPSPGVTRREVSEQALSEQALWNRDDPCYRNAAPDPDERVCFVVWRVATVSVPR